MSNHHPKEIHGTAPSSSVVTDSTAASFRKTTHADPLGPDQTGAVAHRLSTASERPRANSLPLHSSSRTGFLGPSCIDNTFELSPTPLSFRHRRYRAQTAAFTTQPPTIAENSEPVATDTHLDEKGNVKPITDSDDNATKEWKKVLMGLVAVGPGLLLKSKGSCVPAGDVKDSGDIEEGVCGMGSGPGTAPGPTKMPGFIEKLRVWPQAGLGGVIAPGGGVLGRGGAMPGNVVVNGGNGNVQMGQWKYSRLGHTALTTNGGRFGGGGGSQLMTTMKGSQHAQRVQDAVRVAQRGSDMKQSPPRIEKSESMHFGNMQRGSFSPHAPAFVPIKSTNGADVISTAITTTATAAPDTQDEASSIINTQPKKKFVPLDLSQLPGEQTRGRSQSSASAKTEPRYGYGAQRFGATKMARGLMEQVEPVVLNDIRSVNLKTKNAGNGQGALRNTAALNSKLEAADSSFAAMVVQLTAPPKAPPGVKKMGSNTETSLNPPANPPTVSGSVSAPLADPNLLCIKPLVWPHAYNADPLTRNIPRFGDSDIIPANSKLGITLPSLEKDHLWNKDGTSNAHAQKTEILDDERLKKRQADKERMNVEGDGAAGESGTVSFMTEATKDSHIKELLETLIHRSPSITAPPRLQSVPQVYCDTNIVAQHSELPINPTNPAGPGPLQDWVRLMQERNMAKWAHSMVTVKNQWVPWPGFSESWVRERTRLVLEGKVTPVDVMAIEVKEVDRMRMGIRGSGEGKMGIMEGLVVRDDGLWGFAPERKREEEPDQGGVDIGP